MLKNSIFLISKLKINFESARPINKNDLLIINKMSQPNIINNFARSSFPLVSKKSTVTTCYSPLSIAYAY